MTTVIIGGGPAGILASIATSKKNSNFDEKVSKPSQVLLLEKNEKLGKKLFISGKGRCNLTNNVDETEFLKNVVRNPKFLYSSFSEFSNMDLKSLVEANGCPLKVERGNRVFPVSDKSYDVIDALKKAVKASGTKVKLNTEVVSIKKLDNYNKNTKNISKSESSETSQFEIKTKNGETILADKVIIATGGLSYPATGSTGDGYKFAKAMKIKVIDQHPSLVPFNVKEVNECKDMQGLTLKNVAIKIFKSNNLKKVLYSDFGELFFTHFGVSGPIILSASCYINDFDNMVLGIDLKPALSYEQLDNRLLREFEENNKKSLKSIIEKLLPHSLVDIFLKRLENELVVSNEKAKSSLNISDLKVTEISKNERKSIVNLLKDFRFTLIGKRGYDEAIVTSGGIDTKEINPKTMECKNVKGLYFAGEVLDIDALTGGFNIQIACSTGYTAGKNIYAI